MEWFEKVLTEEPVLRLYDPVKPIKILSDASQNNLGAVLLQKFDDWQPIAYAAQWRVLKCDMPESKRSSLA